MPSLHPARLRALVCVLFALLGAQTGLRAVGVSDIYLRLRLTPVQLGLASTAGVCTGIVTLVAGSRLIDRLGRRPLLVVGVAGTGLAYVLNAFVASYPGLLVTWALYGLFVSVIDLGANTVAADHERASGTSAMTGFHAWFSLGAAAGALAAALALDAGLSFRPAFAVLGAVLLAASLLFVRSTLPDHQRSGSLDAASARSVARVPLVLLATAIVFFCFFGDGILETFLSTFVRTSSTALVAGLGVAAFHTASWLGRLLSARVVRRHGERRVLVGAGVVAAAAIVATLTVREGWSITLALAVVGFAVSPIVPIGFSLAGRAAPDATGRAVGFVTAVGYSAFVLSPVVAGVLAGRTSLAWGIGLAALTVLLVPVLALRLPHAAARSRRAGLPSAGRG